MITIGDIKKRWPTAKKILKTATVLHNGWEMDNEIVLVERKDGSLMLVTTNHGGLMKATPDYLFDKVTEYQKITFDSLDILFHYRNGK